MSLAATLCVGVSERLGRKGEDRAAVRPRFNYSDDDYVAVFDGHRGHAVASHAAATLHEVLGAALRRGEAPGAACAAAFAGCHARARELGLTDGAAALCLFTVGGLEGWKQRLAKRAEREKASEEALASERRPRAIVSGR